MGNIMVQRTKTSLEKSLDSKAKEIQSSLEEYRTQWKALQKKRENTLEAIKGWASATDLALEYIAQKGGISKQAYALGTKMLDEAFDHIATLNNRVAEIESAMDAVTEAGKSLTAIEGQLEVQQFRNQFSRHRAVVAQWGTPKMIEDTARSRESKTLYHSIDALIELREDAKSE